jgi:single-strand DNA-binding protein
MALSFNNCSLSGNVGRDPEARYFENGTMVANFSIAVSGRRDSTFWMPVKVWGKQAQTIIDYVKKGSQIIVSGELEEESWEKDGKKNTRMTLNCRDFKLMGGQKPANGGGGSSRAASSSAPTRSKTAQEVDDMEIPF